MLPVTESMTTGECQRVLRRLELEAYCGIVSALRAQGELDSDKRELLQSIQQALSISTERHKAEVRRAVNDETLTSICETLNNSNASLEWAIEGRRLVPLIPRLVPQTAYLQIANQAANEAQALNRSAQLAAQGKKQDAKESTTKSPPSPTVTDPKKASLNDLIVLPHGTKLPGKSVMDNPNPEELFKPKDPPGKTKAIHPHLPHVSSVLAKSQKNATGSLPGPVENPPRSVPAEDPIFTGSSHKSSKVSQPEIVPSSGQKVLFQQAISATTTGYPHPYSAPQGSKYPPPPSTSTHMPSKPHFLHTALTGSNDPPRYLGYGQAGKEKEPHPVSAHPLPWKEPPKKHTPAVIKKSSKHRKRSKHGATSTQAGSSQSAGKSKTTTAPSVGEPPKTSSSKKEKLAVFELPPVSAASTKTMSPVVSSAGSKGSLKYPTSTPAGTGSIFKVTTVGTSTLTTRITTVPSALSSTKYFSAPGSQGSADYSNIFSSAYKPATSSASIVKLNPKALQKAVVQKAGGAQFIPGKPNVIVVQKSQMSKSGQIPRTIPGMVRPVSPVTARPKIIMATTQSNLSSSHPTLGNVRYPAPKPVSTKTQSPVIMSPGGRARQIIPTTVPTSEISSPVKTWSSTHQTVGVHGQKTPVTKSPLMTATKSGFLAATKSSHPTGSMTPTKGTSGSSQSYLSTGAVVQKVPLASGNVPSYLHGSTNTLPKSNASPQPGGTIGKKPTTQGGSSGHSTEVTPQKGGTFGHPAHLPTPKIGQLVTSGIKLADKAGQKGTTGQPVKVTGGTVVQKTPQVVPASAVEGVVTASKGLQSAPSMVIVKQKTTAVTRPSSEMASDEVRGHFPSSKPTQSDSSLGGGLSSESAKSAQIQTKTSPSSQSKEKQTQESLMSELSAASAARALLDIRGQHPVINVSKPAEPRRTVLMPTAPVPVATPVSRSDTISESALHQKSSEVVSKSESLKKTGKGQSSLMTVEDQGVVSERINLSRSDVSIVDQFEEFLEREGLVEAEKSGSAGKETSVLHSKVVTSGDAPQQVSKNQGRSETSSGGSGSKLGKQSLTVEKMDLTGNKTADMSSEKEAGTSKSAAGSAASATPLVGNETTSTKKHLSTPQAVKSTSPEMEKQHVTEKYEDGKRVAQKTVLKQDPVVTSERKVNSGQVVKPVEAARTAELGQTDAIVQQTHPERQTAEPVSTKSSPSESKNRPETFKVDSENKPDPYQWEDSPEAVETDMSDLIRAISQPKISLTKMKRQDDREKEKEVATKVIKLSESSPMPPKPASIVLESPSSSFDISQMNLEDFTSQRLEEMEERDEDIGFAGEKIDSREDEGMLIEARSETGAREDQESSSTAWQEQEESHNEVPVGGTRSLPVGAGGGKKMPSSDKILQEDYPLVSGSDSSVGEASGSETQQVRASKRKRKAPTPIDEETGPSSMPSWARAAWNMLLRVMRFRGANRAKGDINAASWFNRPVDSKESPDYFKIIKTPMDFSTIKRNLENGFYQGFADFHHDMITVRRNCLKFNPPGHKARKDCDEVFQFYQEEYNKTTERWGKVQSAPKSPKRLRPDPSSIK